MIKDCHSFESRIQQLMDSRIDPETDDALWRHSAQCADCYQSLMAYSLMHSEFLNDSDSMKIKLDTLVLMDLKKVQQKRRPRFGYYAAVAASLAAILIVSICLMPDSNGGDVREVAMKSASFRTATAAIRADDVPQTISSSEAVASLASLRQTLDPFEITTLSTPEWTPIQPIKSLSVCFDWLQKSWRRTTKSDGDEIDLGETGQPWSRLVVANMYV